MAETINFTKAVLDALPRPEKRMEYVDARQAGLRLRVSPSGVKTFCVFKRVRGAGMERITLARYPQMTIEQARRKAAEIIGKIAEGDNPAEVRRAIREEPTLDDLFDEFVSRRGPELRSLKIEQQRYRHYLQEPLGKRRLSEITGPMISCVLSDMDRLGKAAATVNNVRALASTIFSHGVEWGRVAANPVSGTKMRKKVSRDRFLQSTELPRFFASLMQEPNDTVRDYFLVSLFTGARRSNVLAMRWREINFDSGVWRIPRTKNGDPQNVTLTQAAMDVLRARRDGAAGNAEFVFPGEGSAGHLVEPKKGWKRIFDRDELERLLQMIEEAGRRLEPKRNEKTGHAVYESMDSKLARARKLATKLGLRVDDVRIKDVRIHDLRRTLGSWQAITGASLPIIGKSLNHKSAQSTTIYARLDLDPVRASVEKATVAMLEAAGVAASTKSGGSEAT